MFSSNCCQIKDERGGVGILVAVEELPFAAGRLVKPCRLVDVDVMRMSPRAPSVAKLECLGSKPLLVFGRFVIFPGFAGGFDRRNLVLVGWRPWIYLLRCSSRVLCRPVGRNTSEPCSSCVVFRNSNTNAM